jgi:hypothetical protein
VGQGDEVFRNDEHGDVVVTIRDDSVEDAATTKGGCEPRFDPLRSGKVPVN